MNDSGKAGSGRGNNRKRPFRWWDRDNKSQKEKEYQHQANSSSGNDSSKINDNFYRNRSFQSSNKKNNNKRNESKGQNFENQNRQNRNGQAKRNYSDNQGEKPVYYERPKWVPPVFNTEPLPAPSCPWCGNPIRDISSAMADKDTGIPVHFDCVSAKIASGENLEKGDIIAYIGGGRFGIVNFAGKDQGRAFSQSQVTGSPDSAYNRVFTIKKVIEWENKDKRAEWRGEICSHYSET